MESEKDTFVAFKSLKEFLRFCERNLLTPGLTEAPKVTVPMPPVTCSSGTSGLGLFPWPENNAKLNVPTGMLKLSKP